MSLFSKNTNNDTALLAQINSVLQDVEDGELSSRVIVTKKETPLEQLA
ncbi:MAG: hypothetical protein FAF04_06720 [Epsilonproteobacteria bacterium]|nr:hypothetical protein [Campylobacterota bacterium]